MKLTNEQIVILINSISNIKDVDMPISESFKFTKDFQKLNDCYTAYETELKKITDDEGKVKDKDKLIELLNLETEVDLETISIEKLEQANVNLSIATINALSPILE